VSNIPEFKSTKLLTTILQTKFEYGSLATKNVPKCPDLCCNKAPCTLRDVYTGDEELVILLSDVISIPRSIDLK
jgi:hypothetical protein